MPPMDITKIINYNKMYKLLLIVRWMRMKQSLRVFIEVVDKGNFSKAAASLFMTQPAVSQYMKSLEREIGASLLNRTNKTVQLTKAGSIVYQHAKEIIGHYETMHHLVQEMFHEPKGELAIGASYTFGEYVLPRFIAKLRETFPLIQPKITIGNTQDIAKQVEEMSLDIGIVEGEVEGEALEVDPFARDQMCIVAPIDHPIALKRDLSVEQLENETWIIREEGSGTREAAGKLFDQIGISPKNMMEFGSTQIIKESVEAGLGLTILSLWTIRKELSMETLAVVELPNGKLDRSFSIVLRNKPMHTKATVVFRDLLKKMLTKEE